MTSLLKKAIEKLESLPDDRQNLYAQEILESLDGDTRWDELFADPRSEQALSEMARKARAEYEAGETISMEDFLKTTEK